LALEKASFVGFSELSFVNVIEEFGVFSRTKIKKIKMLSSQVKKPGGEKNIVSSPDRQENKGWLFPNDIMLLKKCFFSKTY
jgi:hypothetical protein